MMWNSQFEYACYWDIGINLGHIRPHVCTMCFPTFDSFAKWCACGENGWFWCGNCHTVFSSHLEIGIKIVWLKFMSLILCEYGYSVDICTNTIVYVCCLCVLWKIVIFFELRTINIRNVMVTAAAAGDDGVIKSIWIYYRAAHRYNIVHINK